MPVRKSITLLKLLSEHTETCAQCDAWCNTKDDDTEMCRTGLDLLKQAHIHAESERIRPQIEDFDQKGAAQPAFA